MMLSVPRISNSVAANTTRPVPRMTYPLRLFTVESTLTEAPDGVGKMSPGSPRSACRDRVDRIEAHAGVLPRVAPVGAVEDASVGHAGDQLAVARRERIGHGIARRRKPSPRTIPPVEVPAGAPAAVGGAGTGGGGHPPPIRVVRIDGQGPAVAEAPSRVGGLPRASAVAAPGGAVSRRLVGAVLRLGVP